MTSERGFDQAVGLTVALAVVAVFVTYLPIGSVAVSLSTIRTATKASTGDLQWVSDAYVIPMAAAILSAGVFGDIHGRRRVYLIGTAVTTLGALVAGLADLFAGHHALDVLWAGQAIMGTGAGMLLPTTLALIAHAAPELRDRARYVTMWATGLAGGLAFGPLIAGLILDQASWGWVFAPVGVLAVATGLAGWRALPESSAAGGRQLDWPGQVTATVMITATIFGVIEAGESGWGSAFAVVGLSLGAIALVSFIAVELRSAAPLVELRLFRSGAFSAPGLAALVALFVLVGSLFLLSIFFGAGEHLSALQIGVRLLFVNGVTALASPLAARLMSRWHPTGILTFGLVLGAGAMLSLTGLNLHSSLSAAAWRLAILGFANAFILSALSVAAIQAVPHRLAGMASATNTALRQFGGALGPAVLGLIFASRIHHGSGMASALHTSFEVCAAALAVAAVACAASVMWPWLSTRSAVAVGQSSGHEA